MKEKAEDEDENEDEDDGCRRGCAPPPTTVFLEQRRSLPSEALAKEGATEVEEKQVLSLSLRSLV
jgi:hypothetical protein